MPGLARVSRPWWCITGAGDLDRTVQAGAHRDVFYSAAGRHAAAGPWAVGRIVQRALRVATLGAVRSSEDVILSQALDGSPDAGL